MADQFGNYQAGMTDSGTQLAFYDGSGSPVSVITPGATITLAVYRNTDNGDIWEWTLARGSWLKKTISFP